MRKINDLSYRTACRMIRCKRMSHETSLFRLSHSFRRKRSHRQLKYMLLHCYKSVLWFTAVTPALWPPGPNRVIRTPRTGSTINFFPNVTNYTLTVIESLVICTCEIFSFPVTFSRARAQPIAFLAVIYSAAAGARAQSRSPSGSWSTRDVEQCRSQRLIRARNEERLEFESERTEEPRHY